MLSLAKLEMRATPYPYGWAEAVFAPEMYRLLHGAFPDRRSLWLRLAGSGYNKLSLSERCHPAEYERVIAGPPWYAFHRYIKSPAFLNDVFDPLAAHGMSWDRGPWRARFEFSVLPGEGGYILPHTDTAQKIITLVIGLVEEPWDLAWGGGTEILQQVDPTAVLESYKAHWDAFETQGLVPHVANQAMVFIKGPYSWHGVRPVQAPPGRWRRTLTINIER